MSKREEITLECSTWNVDINIDKQPICGVGCLSLKTEKFTIDNCKEKCYTVVIE